MTAQTKLPTPNLSQMGGGGANYFTSTQAALYLGDCLELLRQFEPCSFDLIFADPPYKLSNDGISVASGRRVSVNKANWDKSRGFEVDVDFHDRWLEACRRVLKDDGSLWLSGTYHSIYQCGFILQKQGWQIINDVAWFKPNATPNISCRSLTASHETLIWAKKTKKAKHCFNYRALKQGQFTSDQLKTPNRQMRSVWSITTPKPSEKRAGKHPTQKPLALLERIIMASSNPGDLVLDPFIGSGTTALAAVKLKRFCLGIDKRPDYLEIAKNRLLTQAASN